MKRQILRKVISIALVMCLVITLIPDIGHAAETDDMQQETAVVSAEDESEDSAEAVADPAMEGLTEEDVVEKTENTTTFDTGDGMKTVVLHAGQVRFENEEGELTDYDPSLVEIKQGEKTETGESLKKYRFTNREGDKKQYLPEKLSGDTPVLMEYGAHQISLVPSDETLEDLGLEECEAEVSEDIIPGLYDGEGESLPVNAVYGSEEDAAIYTYQSGDAGIKETLTLNEKPESNVFTYDISVGDLLLRKNQLDEGITVIDPETEDIVAVIEAPWMNDETGEAYSTDITYDLEAKEAEGEYLITMTINEEYLADENRVYPVTIDPTVTWKGNDMIRDVFVNSAKPTTNFYNSSQQVMPAGRGSSGNIYRTYIKFLNLKAEIKGKSVASAKLTMYETGDGASGQTVRVNRILEEWSASTVTYNSIPDHNTSAYIAQQTSTATAKKAITFDLTAFARGVSNDTSNYGVVLRNASNPAGYTEFYGSRTTLTSYRPKLVVTYHDKPASLTSASVHRSSSTSSTGYINTSYFGKGRGVYASWEGIDSYDLAAVQYRFEAYDQDTAAPTSVGDAGVDLTSYRNTGVAASSYSYLYIPYSMHLTEGKYKMYLRGKDSAGGVGTGKYKVVIFDWTAPSLTGVTVSPSTSASSYTSDLTPTVSWNASDKYLSNVEIYVNGKSVKTVSSAGQKSYTIPSGVIKKSGTHTIKLTARDKAGNATTVTKSYYVDVTAPMISSFTAAAGKLPSAPSSDTTPALTWQVTDTDLSKLEVYVDGVKAASPAATSAGCTLPAGYFSTEGAHDIELAAVDSSGNTSRKKITYYLDNEKPVIEELSITPETGILSSSANKSPVISWNMTDTACEGIYYSFDGSSWKLMGRDMTGTFTVPPSDFTDGDGRYTIYVKAKDTAGNESDAEELTYHLDTSSGSYAPENLAVTQHYGKRHVTWELDAYDDIYRYDIHRGTSSGFTPSDSTLIASDISAADCLYIDNEVLAAGTYYYKIKVTERDAASPETAVSSAASIANTVTSADFAGTLGNKDYLSYTEVDMPTGTAQIEESSGNLLFEQTDYSVSNAGFDYGMTRTYNSKSSMTGMTGKGWTDSYHMELYRSGNDVYFRDTDGSSLRFAKSGSTYSCEETKEYVLAETDTGYTLTSKDDTVYAFNAYGQLLKMEDANGCCIINSYDSKGRLSSVATDTEATDNRKLTFIYASDGYLLDSVTDFEGTEYRYTYSGVNVTRLKVTGASDKPGNVEYNYGYTDAGILKDIFDGKGNKYSFTYSSGKVSTASYPDGETISLSYAAGSTEVTKKTSGGDTILTAKTTFDQTTGKVISHTDPDGDVTSLEYSAANPYLVAKETAVTGYETLSSGTVTIKDDTQTKVYETVTYTYDDDENLTKEVSSDGSVTDYTYDENGQVLTEKTVEDSQTITDTTYSYDDAGNLESEFDAVADTQIAYDYDADGNETACVELSGVETEITDTDSILSDTDISGTAEMSRTETEYDTDGNPDEATSETAEVDTDSTSEFDEMGRETKRTENGVTTVTEYDFLGRAVKVTVKEEGLSDIVTESSYDGNGSLVSEETTGGVKKEYTYDSRNRNTQEKTTGSGMQSRIRNISYGYQNNVAVKDGRTGRTESICYTETVTDTAGNTVSKTYTDNEGNTVKEETGSTYTDYTYDKAGNQVVTYTGSSSGSAYQLSLQLYDADGNNFANISDPGVSGTNYTVKDSSIITQSTFDAKGNVLTETDGSGTVTAYTYDDEGRLTGVDIAQGEDSITELTASYSLDDDGDTVTAVTDGNGNKKIETVNAAGLTKETKDIDTGTNENMSTGYVYDSLGRKTKEEYSDDSYITYSYSGDSQRITESRAYKAGGSLESTTSYSYDSYGRVSDIVCKDASGTVVCTTGYTRDAEGKVLTESRTYKGKSKQTITYSYDSEGRLISKAYPSSSGLGTVNYTYDSQGRCTKISKGSSTVRAYVYDGLGRVSAIKDYDKPGSSSFIETNYTYDSHGRAVSMVSENDGSASAVLESHAYTYDDNGNILTYTHVNDLPAAGKKINETREYTYNKRGFLTKSIKTDNLTATAVTSEYTYDDAGNRKTETVNGVKSTYSYNGLNQLEEVTSGDTVTGYTYDERGNQIKEEVSTVTGDEGSETVTGVKTVTTGYAVTGELTELTEKTGNTTTLTQTNVYDHNGQRIARTQNGTTRSYYYDNGVVAFTEDGTSMSSANVLSDSGAVVGSYRGSVYHNYLTDMQGSTTSIVKEDGSLSAAYTYTDFGETTDITGGTFDNQICYTGGIYDKETGLYYLNARYYDPETGRFISQDTYRGELDDPGQWHLYAYCANNPINYVDPSGHARIPEWILCALEKNIITRTEKNKIRLFISGAATAYLNSKGYTLARKLFNHALWGYGKAPNKKTNEAIKSKLKTSILFKSALKKNRNSRKALSIEFTSGDLYYAIQKMNYKIISCSKKGRSYLLKVTAWDSYDFDEIRKPLFTFSNASNNLGVLLEKCRISYSYDWSVTFNVTVR